MRSLSFRTDVALLQLGGSTVTDRGDHLVVRTPHNPTFWWGNFLLLRDVPDDGPRWVDRFLADFPSAAHVALGVDVPDAGVDDLAWFAAQGFAVSADAVLTAHEVSASERDVDTECRRLISDDDWTQSVALNLTDHDPDDEAQSRFVRSKVRTNRALTLAGHGAWFGAFVDGRLVAELGLVRAGDGLARYQAVLTHPDFRRRGYATALVVEAGRYGRTALDADTLVIVADPAAPAFGLYRSLGFVHSESQVSAQRGA